MTAKQSVQLTPGTIAAITIERPESLNALNREVLEALQSALKQACADSETRVIQIWGAGDKAFVAGADIKAMNELQGQAVRDYVELGQGLMNAIEQCAVPVVAAVDGFALGGGLELALACDLIIASSRARVGQPEVQLGLIPGFGGTQRLLQRCGIGIARRLVYTGEIIGAEEAYQLGVVDMIIEHDGFAPGVQTISESIAAKAPLAVARAKQVIREAGVQSLSAGLQREVEAFLGLFDTADRKEGIEAFLSKRDPIFQGK